MCLPEKHAGAGRAGQRAASVLSEQCGPHAQNKGQRKVSRAWGSLGTGWGMGGSQPLHFQRAPPPGSRAGSGVVKVRILAQPSEHSCVLDASLLPRPDPL